MYKIVKVHPHTTCISALIHVQILRFNIQFFTLKINSTISTYNLPIIEDAISWFSFRININLALLRFLAARRVSFSSWILSISPCNFLFSSLSFSISRSWTFCFSCPKIKKNVLNETLIVVFFLLCILYQNSSSQILFSYYSCLIYHHKHHIGWWVLF